MQESELLVTNLGDKLLQGHEVLCDIPSLKLLANLHESLVSVNLLGRLVILLIIIYIYSALSTPEGRLKALKIFGATC